MEEQLTGESAQLLDLMLAEVGDDRRNCIVEIRAGTGGDEAASSNAAMHEATLGAHSRGVTRARDSRFREISNRAGGCTSRELTLVIA